MALDQNTGNLFSFQNLGHACTELDTELGTGGADEGRGNTNGHAATATKGGSVGLTNQNTVGICTLQPAGASGRWVGGWKLEVGSSVGGQTDAADRRNTASLGYLNGKGAGLFYSYLPSVFRPLPSATKRHAQSPSGPSSVSFPRAIPSPVIIGGGYNPE
ncbi:MAG: hypothetical protein M1840_002916 [Geoglossum simile]|nr:MAG: hypothetical protein M1840_002916 [Geoglossum simile]